MRSSICDEICSVRRKSMPISWYGMPSSFLTIEVIDELKQCVDLLRRDLELRGEGGQPIDQASASLTGAGFTVSRLDDESLVNGIAQIAPLDVASKQALLEAPSLTARAELLVALTEINLKRSEGGSSRRLQPRHRRRVAARS